MITARERYARNGHAGAVIWLTGRPAAGKSTLACHLERLLFDRGMNVLRLDADELRRGLSSDLGYSPIDRNENVRRIGEIAATIACNGFLCIVACISSFKIHRELASRAAHATRFIEVFVDASFEECERRDPKGLYRQARNGTLKNFTGLDSPYERPEHPDLRIDTEVLGKEESAERVAQFVQMAAQLTNM